MAAGVCLVFINKMKVINIIWVILWSRLNIIKRFKTVKANWFFVIAYT